MRNLLTIFKRELGAYFKSPIAAIFVIVFVVLNNGLFMLQFFQIGKADMRGFFNFMPYALTIFVPAIAMRLWAEERRTTTYELLLTLPMKPHQPVLGKYLASVVFYLFSLAMTFCIPLLIAMVGQADPGPIIGGYLGAFMVGALFLAVGIFISGLCKDQIVAFILTMVVCFALFMLGADSTAAFVDGWVSGLGTWIKNTIGLVTHLTAFSRGIIDLMDFVYFGALIGAFLFLNGLSLEGRMRPKSKAVFSVAVVVCLVSAMLLSWLVQGISAARFDITEGKIYTVSPVTAKILKNLKVPVTVKLYISPVDTMPTALKTLEQDVVDKLEELRISSDGKLKYRVVHLEPLEGKEEESRKSLQEQGIAPFQVESVQKDEVGVKLIYSTLAIEYKEKPTEVVPRVIPASMETLEYQLLSRIYKMTRDDRPKIAVFAPATKADRNEEIEKLLSSSGEKESASYEDAFKTAVLLMRNNGFDTRRIALVKDDGIPEKTDTLVILNPGKLNERQRYEINKYLYQGGRVLVAAQGFEFTYKREVTGAQAVPQKMNISDINSLMEKWGVKINGDILCDLESQVISITTGQRIGPFALEMPVKFPNQIIVREEQINQEPAITERIPSLFYLWGSALDLSQDTLKSLGLKSTTLFSSSPRSWKMANDGYTNLTETNTATPTGPSGPFPLAVLIEGAFSNTFTGTAAPAWPAKDPAAATPSDGKPVAATEEIKWGEPKPGKLLVIGDHKIFAEESIQNPGNINFFANIIDGFALGEDLIEIRSKSSVVRDIKHLSNVEKLGYRFLAVFLVPLLLLASSLLRAFLRKKEKEFYLRAIKN